MKIVDEGEILLIQTHGMFEAEEFTSRVTEKLAATERFVILIDWEGSRYLCSEDISALVVTNRKIAQRQGKMYFCNVCDELYSQLECFNLHHLFNIRETEEKIRQELDGGN